MFTIILRALIVGVRSGFILGSDYKLHGCAFQVFGRYCLKVLYACIRVRFLKV